ncbi:Toxin ParE [Pirellulimonas nuda]|uniref:Toxin ParE n=1 Tax=Pirellulimonas nuda TaxID=2528009 RepID=A0A518D680_9BACT|nr:type II toxin-antitoxin system RelE/ParE family toxin [Pirellulimonas nuda]QDU86980.1 Toxin ParE [Pirellulimonas nuda]
MSPQLSAEVRLTQRALADLREILDYSTQEWGERTAQGYLDDLEAGLVRIAVQPESLATFPGLADHMRFYRVNKHLLICDVEPTSVVVLTVIHASRDIPNRLAELAPLLARKVESLHRNLRGRE